MNTRKKIIDHETLISILREELQEYGGLLRLLNKQQKCIVRGGGELLAIHLSIDNQLKLNENLRKEREVIVKAHAEEVLLPSKSTMRDLIPYFSESVQGLFLGLFEEMSATVTRSRHKARENQKLLSRICKMTERVVHTLEK